MRDVLAALADVPGLHALAVVTSEPAARSAAEAAGATVIADRSRTGSLAPRRSGSSTPSRPATSAPCSCRGTRHWPTRASSRRFSPGAGRPPAVTIVPDRHGTGTNALLLAPPDAIAPSFGPGSLARHTAAARAAGIEPRTEAVPTLVLDVDTGDDLAAMAALALAEQPDAAARARAALDGEP